MTPPRHRPTRLETAQEAIRLAIDALNLFDADKCDCGQDDGCPICKAWRALQAEARRSARGRRGA